MATASAAALLDELMGRQRNIEPGNIRREPKWDDEEVCKWYLTSFCPHDLFTNTRADLGVCDRIHDDEMKEAYRKSKRFEKCGYEENFLRYLKTILQDVERRIRRGQERLALNNMQTTIGPDGQITTDDRVQLLTERINELVKQAEELGCEGKVEEAQGVLKLCDKLKEDRTEIQNGVRGQLNPNSKEMEVCSVCGAFLVVGDAPSRQEEHLMGKQHMGFARVRSTIEKLEAAFGRNTAPPEKQERERDRLSHSSRSKERSHSRDRERKRRGSRERRRRSRSRDRRKDRKRDRS